MNNGQSHEVRSLEQDAGAHYGAAAGLEYSIMNPTPTV